MVSDPVVLFDNVRTLPRAISDEFCRLLTGGNLPNFRVGFPAYGHHSSARVVMTAIANPIVAEDLASRALVIEIGDGHDRRFLEQGRPSASTIREIALDLVAAISRTIAEKHSATQLAAKLAGTSTVAASCVNAKAKNVKSDTYRFGRFWTHVKDCGNYAGVPHLEKAIQKNRKQIDVANAGDDPLVIAIRLFLSKRTEDKPWSGSAGELATELAEIKDNARYVEPAWLRNPRSLSVALAHRAHTLAAANVSYSRTGQRSIACTSSILLLRRWLARPKRGPRKRISRTRQSLTRRTRTTHALWDRLLDAGLDILRFALFAFCVWPQQRS